MTVCFAPYLVMYALLLCVFSAWHGSPDVRHRMLRVGIGILRLLNKFGCTHSTMDLPFEPALMPPDLS